MSPQNEPTREEITDLLVQWSDGDPEARERLMPIVVHELRRLAGAYFRNESPGHTLQPTALVNEMYMRLVDQKRVSWQTRAQFYKFAGELMRRILVDHARAKRAAKRGAGAAKIPLEDALGAGVEPEVDLIELDQVLERLAQIDPRQAKVVELRFFTGLTYDEIAEALGVAAKTAKRDWTTARLWLARELAAHRE